MKFNRICVLGLGYIGLPTAATFATRGLKVIGVDINPAVVQSLDKGEPHIHEPGLRDLVREARNSGNLSIADQAAEADAFLIAVPTPFHPDKFGSHDDESYKLADLQFVVAAAEAIVPHLRKGNLVVLESTSPPRTTVDVVAPILERTGMKAGVEFHLCYSPERVLPGQILRELLENARVIGGVTPESADAGAALYSTFVTGEIFKTDATTAEMVKLMENTYRDVNLAIANEFSRLAERFGVDVWEAIELANRHPRVKILTPGPGVGGHCVSVDPWFFVEAAPELTSLIARARKVNDAQPAFVVEKLRQAVGDLKGRRIAALGLTYKPDVDDVRESPAVEVIHLLTHAGAIVSAYEPFRSDARLEGIHSVATLDEALEDADAIVLLVRHSQFQTLSPTEIGSKTRARIILDTVNAWDPRAWGDAGFLFYRLGANKVPSVHHKP